MMYNITDYFNLEKKTIYFYHFSKIWYYHFVDIYGAASDPFVAWLYIPQFKNAVLRR